MDKLDIQPVDQSLDLQPVESPQPLDLQPLDLQPVKGKIGFGEVFKTTPKSTYVPFVSGVPEIVGMIKEPEVYKAKMQEEQQRGFTWGGRVAQGLTVLPAYMGEFATLGGIATRASKIAAKEALKAGIKVGLSQGARKSVAKYGAGWLAGSAARTALQPNRWVKGTLEQQQLSPNQGIATSFFKSIGDTMIENMSEVTGEAIQTSLTKMLPTRLSQGLVDLWKKIHPNQALTKMLTKSGYNGFIGEVGEEVLGDLMRGAVGVDDFGATDPNNPFNRMLSAIPDLEELGVMSTVLAVPGAAQLATSEAAKGLVSKVQKNKIKTTMQKAGRTPDEIKATLEFYDHIRLCTNLKEILDKITQEEVAPETFQIAENKWDSVNNAYVTNLQPPAKIDVARRNDNIVRLNQQNVEYKDAKGNTQRIPFVQLPLLFKNDFFNKELPTNDKELAINLSNAWQKDMDDNVAYLSGGDPESKDSTVMFPRLLATPAVGQAYSPTIQELASKVAQLESLGLMDRKDIKFRSFDQLNPEIFRSTLLRELEGAGAKPISVPEPEIAPITPLEQVAQEQADLLKQAPETRVSETPSVPVEEIPTQEPSLPVQEPSAPVEAPKRGKPQSVIIPTQLADWIKKFEDPLSAESILFKDVVVSRSSVKNAKLAVTDKMIPFAKVVRGKKPHVVIYTDLLVQGYQDYLKGTLKPLSKIYKDVFIPPGLSEKEFVEFVISHERMHIATGLDGGVADEIMCNILALNYMGRTDLAETLYLTLSDQLKAAPTSENQATVNLELKKPSVMVPLLERTKPELMTTSVLDSFEKQIEALAEERLRLTDMLKKASPQLKISLKAQIKASKDQSDLIHQRIEQLKSLQYQEVKAKQTEANSEIIQHFRDKGNLHRGATSIDPETVSTTTGEIQAQSPDQVAKNFYLLKKDYEDSLKQLNDTFFVPGQEGTQEPGTYKEGYQENKDFITKMYEDEIRTMFLSSVEPALREQKEQNLRSMNMEELEEVLKSSSLFSKPDAIFQADDETETDITEEPTEEESEEFGQEYREDAEEDEDNFPFGRVFGNAPNTKLGDKAREVNAMFVRLKHKVALKAIQSLDDYLYSDTKGAEVKSEIREYVRGYVNEKYPEAQDERQRLITLAYLHLMLSSAAEIGVNHNSPLGHMFVTLQGSGGNFSSTEAENAFNAHYKALDEEFTNVGIPIFQKNQKFTARPRLAYWSLLPPDLQKVVLWAKQSIELPILDKQIAAGLFDNTDISFHRLNGFVHRPWILEKQPIYGYATVIKSNQIPHAKYPTFDEFWYETTKAGGKNIEEGELTGKAIKVIPDFSVAMGDYVTDSMKRVYQQNFLTLMSSTLNTDGLPFVLFQNVLPKLALSDAQVLKKLNMTADSQGAERILKVYRNNVSDGIFKSEGFLTDLKYEPMKNAEGLAEWSKGSFHDPWVHSDFKDTLTSVLRSSKSSDITTTWLQATGFMTRILLASPYGVYMDNAFSSSLMNKDGKLSGFWSPKTWESAKRWLPHNLIYHWAKTGKALAKTTVFTQQKEAVKMGEMDPIILDEMQRYGVPAVIPGSIFKEIYDQVVSDPLLMTRKEIRKELIASKLGLDHYVIGRLIPTYSYRMYVGVKNALKNAEPSITNEDAGLAAAKITQEAQYNLSRKVYGNMRTLIKSSAFGADVLFGQLRIFAGALYPVWEKAHQYYEIKSEAQTPEEKVKIRALNIVRGLTNIVLSGDASPETMKRLTRIYRGYAVKLAITDVVLIQLLQAALMGAFYAFSKINGGGDDDKDWKDFLIIYNDPWHWLDIGTPFKDEVGNRIYLGINAFREIEDIIQFFQKESQQLGSGAANFVMKHLRVGIKPTVESLFNRNLNTGKPLRYKGATLLENIAAETKHWAPSMTPSFFNAQEKLGNVGQQRLLKTFGVRTKSSTPERAPVFEKAEKMKDRIEYWQAQSQNYLWTYSLEHLKKMVGKEITIDQFNNEVIRRYKQAQGVPSFDLADTMAKYNLMKSVRE